MTVPPRRLCPEPNFLEVGKHIRQTSENLLLILPYLIVTHDIGAPRQASRIPSHKRLGFVLRAEIPECKIGRAFPISGDEASIIRHPNSEPYIELLYRSPWP